MNGEPGRPKNPYRPGAAVKPLHLAGREKSIRNFDRTLNGSPEVPANMKVTGLRGVGKTVLLKELEERAKGQHGWVTSRVQLEPRHNRDVELTDLIVDLAARASRQASRSARIKARVKGAAEAARGLVSVSYEEIDFSFSGTSQNAITLTEALYTAAADADRNGYEGYLLMLDEAQLLRDDRSAEGEHPLSLLVAAVNDLQEESIPLALVLCGLPTLKANLLKARTYSERMFRGEEIGRLAGPPDGTAAEEAFVRPLEGTGITATDGLVQRVVEQVEPDIYSRLDNDFYATRVESLTPAEQDLLMATAQCSYPPLRSSEIRGNSNKRDGNVNVLMGRLSDQGVVYRIQKGTYEYTAPKFHDYLQRRSAQLGAK